MYPPQQPWRPPQQPPQYYAPQYHQNTNNAFIMAAPQQRQPGCLIRALYYLFIGWWLGYLWLCIGFGFCILIITLPVGLTMLNRLPTVLTLRPSSSPTMNVSMGPGGMSIRMQPSQQPNFLLRALYFICIGWWLGFIIANIGYALCLFLVTLPAGLMILNRLPAVLTLRKN